MAITEMEPDEIASNALGTGTPTEMVTYNLILTVFFIITSSVGLFFTAIFAGATGLLAGIGLLRFIPQVDDAWPFSS